MANHPCTNKACKSVGLPHPNCRCAPPMAHGGLLLPFCYTSQAHNPDCEYFQASSPGVTGLDSRLEQHFADGETVLPAVPASMTQPNAVDYERLARERAPYTQAPFEVPGTAGLDPSKSQTEFVGQILESGKHTSKAPMEGIEEDPIPEFVGQLAAAPAYATAKSFGKAAIKAAPGIVGNEIGAIGSAAARKAEPLASDFSVLTAENPSGVVQSAEANAKNLELLKEDLKKSGLEFHPVKGNYGGTEENSLLVPHIDAATKAKIEELGAKHGQESVLHRTGDVNELRYVSGVHQGKSLSGAGITHDPNLTENFSQLGKNKFQANLDFSKDPEFRGNLVHYSQEANPETIDPRFMGKGAGGAEHQRGDILPRSYYYEAGTKPEDIVTSKAISRNEIARPGKILDLASEEAMPFRAEASDVNDLERRIKDAGYSGYKNSEHPHIPNAVALFEPQKVIAREPTGRAIGVEPKVTPIALQPESVVTREPHPSDTYKEAVVANIEKNFQNAKPNYLGQVGDVHVMQATHDDHKNLIGAHTHPEDAQDLARALEDAEAQGFQTLIIHGEIPKESIKELGLTPPPKQLAAPAKQLPAAAAPVVEDLHATPHAPIFYSKLQNTIQEKMGPTATKQQVEGLLRDIKGEERQYSAIDDLLGDLKPEDKVSKADLLNHLKENNLQVGEVVKGGETRSVEQGADVYQIFSKDGEGAGIFLDKENAKTMMEKGDTLQRVEWDGESTIEDMQFHGGSSTSSPTKFSKYQTPGPAENYREKLWTLPQQEGPAVRAWADYRKYLENKYGTTDYLNSGKLSDLEDETLTNLHRAAGHGAGDPNLNYTSPHWDEPNVIAHSRLSDRVDAEGKKVLHIDEIQSDWHQAGRKEGYKGSADIQSLVAEREKLFQEKESYLAQYHKSVSTELEQLDKDANKLNKTAQQYVDAGKDAPQELLDQYAAIGDRRDALQTGKGFPSSGPLDRDKLRILNNKIGSIGDVIADDKRSVPDAPFKKTWHEHALKRILREAAENNQDRITWTTGAQQAERYDLSKQVSHITAKPIGDGKFKVDVWASGADEDADAAASFVATPKELEAHVGKDLAGKIEREEGIKAGPKGDSRLYKDKDLKVGGEGMKGFYDKMIPDYLNKIGKKYGVKVGETRLAGEVPIGNAPDELAAWQKSVDKLHAQRTKAAESDLTEFVPATVGRRPINSFPGEKTFESTSIPEIKLSTFAGSSADPFVVSWDHRNMIGIYHTKKEMTRKLPGDIQKFLDKHIGEQELHLKEAIEAQAADKGIKVHSFDLTPAMKKALLKEGQSMFFAGGTVPGALQKFARGGMAFPLAAQHFVDGGMAQAAVPSVSPLPSGEPESPHEFPEQTQLFQNETGQLGHLPHQEVTPGIASGLFSFPKGQQIQVFNPEGKLGYLPAEETHAAFQSGYTYASPQMANEYSLQQKYGEGAGNVAKSFALGAANTATFGLANQALVRSGAMSPEAISQISARSPYAHILGDITGVAAPMLLTPGAGLIKGLEAAYEAALVAGDAANIARTSEAIQTAKQAFSTFGAADLANPVVGLAKVGSKVSEGVAAALPEGTSVLGKTLANMASKGAGSAVEGLGFTAGNQVSEQVLGDPNEAGQSLLAQYGTSAALGGTLGAAVGAGEVLIPAAFKAAKVATQELRARFWGAPGEGKLADKVGAASDKLMAFASGAAKEDIENVRVHRDMFLHPEENTEAYSREFAKAQQDTYDKLNRSVKNIKSEIRDPETEILLHQGNKDLSTQEFAKINKTLTQTIDHLRAESEIYSPSAARQLEKYREAYLGKPGIEPEITAEGLSMARMEHGDVTPGSPADAFKAIDSLKNNLDDIIKYNRASTNPVDMRTQGVLKDLRQTLRQTLENPSVWGEAGARQAAFNDATHELLTTQSAFEKQFMTKGASGIPKVDPIKVSSYLKSIDTIRGQVKSDLLVDYENAKQKYLTEVERSYANIPGKSFNRKSIEELAQKSTQMQGEFQSKAATEGAMARLKIASEHGHEGAGAVMAYAAHSLGVPSSIIAAAYAAASPYQTIQRLAKMEKLIGKTSEQIERGVKSIIKAGKPLTSTTAIGLVAGKHASAISSAKAYKERVDEIRQNANNTEGLMEKLESSTASVHAHAPKIAASMQQTIIRATSFLNSKIPDTGPVTPMGPKLHPSAADINKFNRYYNAVQNPLSVLQQIKSGTLTNEASEAVQFVYPDLYKKMYSQVIETLSQHGDKPVPYKVKMGLSLFLNKDMDLSTSSLSIASNQATNSGAQQEQNQKDANFMKPTAKGIGSISTPERLLTPAQASASRNH